MQSRQDLIQLELTEDEAQEIINSLPENNWAGMSVKTKVNYPRPEGRELVRLPLFPQED